MLNSGRCVKLTSIGCEYSDEERPFWRQKNRWQSMPSIFIFYMLSLECRIKMVYIMNGFFEIKEVINYESKS